MSGDWRPASVADSKLAGSACSTKPAQKSPTYSFGHGIQPGGGKAPAAPDADLTAAVWWDGSHKPTTNDARNRDVAQFWEGCKHNGADAVQHITGTAVARAVKEAGRGTHMALGCEDAHQVHSRYTAEFCKPAQERAANGSAAQRIAQAKRDADANKALGRSSSVNLSFMW